MSSWSSCCESFYARMLERRNFQHREEKNENFILNQVIDSSCCDISVKRSTLQPSSLCNDDLFSSSDSILTLRDLGYNSHDDRFILPMAKVVCKNTGNHTSRRIHNLHFSVGNLKNGIHTIPYEKSQYSPLFSTKYGSKAIPKTNLYALLQSEIVNSLHSINIYAGNEPKDIIFMPSGVQNAGIKALEIDPNINNGHVELSCRELILIYPSSFFSYNKPQSQYFMDPYNNSEAASRIECSWDGYSIKSQIYGDEKFCNIYEDFDILQLTSNLSSKSSSTIYARNSLGIFVFQYYFADDKFNIRTLNNVSYKPDEKVFYINTSPYVGNEAVFLTTSNKLLIYDSILAHESESVGLSELVGLESDLIQTVGYGMDNNTLVFGGNRLYVFDKRSNDLFPLFLPIKSNITVTSGKWTERKFEYEYPSRHFSHQLSGRSCAFSSYWLSSKPSFWESFTACEVHPFYNFILAAICGISNSVFIIDLRIPTSPLLDIPLPSTEFMGSRFRSLKWSFTKSESLIFAFAHRQRFPISVKITINSSFDSYSISNNKSYSKEDFEDFHQDVDTTIDFYNCRYHNFLNVDAKQEDLDFPSFSPCTNSQSKYLDLPIHVVKDSCLTSIFHGYLGFTVIRFVDPTVTLAFVFTTSGKLLALDFDNRNIKLVQPIQVAGDDLLLRGFDIKEKRINHLIIDGNLVDYLKVGRKMMKEKFDLIHPINLSENFTKIQEQHFSDFRRFSNISINNIYSDESTKFNSLEILKGLMNLKFNLEFDDGLILSMSKFKRLHPNEDVDKYQVWNPLEHLLDPNTTVQTLCGCGRDENLLDELDKRIQSGETLFIDEGLSNTFGPTIFLQSLDKDKVEVDHGKDCTLDYFISIKIKQLDELGDEVNEDEGMEFVHEILSSW